MNPIADVVRVDFANCVLLRVDGTLIDATVRGRMMGPRKSLGNALVVGDRASYEMDGERARVDSIEPRRNGFSRRASGNQPLEQVVAANLDQVVFVASVRHPEFRLGLADRVLAQAEYSRIAARLVLTKMDLASEAEAGSLMADYRAAGFAVDAVSATSGRGIEELHQACIGRRTLFVGHSGVGKSTLLNALVPGLALLEGAVNQKTLKGRHTTTAAWMVRPEPGFEMIDTPGIRSFGLWGVHSRDLDQHYPEFRAFLGTCRFPDCAHHAEPDCSVRKAVAAGAIPARRFESFLKLRDELMREEAGEVERVRATTRYRR